MSEGEYAGTRKSDWKSVPASSANRQAPSLQAARDAARRSQCSNNLKQIGLAWQNHHDTYKLLPTPGDNGPTACCSADNIEDFNWTYHILPFMEQENLHSLATSNLSQLNKSPVDGYYCPSRRQVRLYKNHAVCDYEISKGAPVKEDK